MPRNCVIFSGGEQGKPLPIAKEDFVIACDKGYLYARHEGIQPQLVLGDFDSLPGEPPDDAKVYPREKDDTDTMLAVKYAVEHGFERIELRCALGGRLDHALANLQAGAYAAERGRSVVIRGRWDTVYLLSRGELHLPRRAGCSISLLSFSDRCTDVSVCGLRYPLQNAVLTSSFPLGISNEWSDSEAVIRMGEGILLIVVSQLNFERDV